MFIAFVNSHDSPDTLLSLFYSCGNWGSEMPIDFLKVPIVSEGARNSVSLAPDCSMPLAVGHKQRLSIIWAQRPWGMAGRSPRTGQTQAAVRIHQGVCGRPLFPRAAFPQWLGSAARMLSPMTLSTMPEWNSPPLAPYSAKAPVNILVCTVTWTYSFLTFLCDSDVCMHAQPLQLCQVLFDPVDCSLLLSMGVSRQKYWSGLSFPSSGDLPNPGIKPASLMSPTLAGGFFAPSITWEAHWRWWFQL